MTPKGHAIPSKTQLLSYGTPALGGGFFQRVAKAPRCLRGFPGMKVKRNMTDRLIGHMSGCGGWI